MSEDRSGKSFGSLPPPGGGKEELRATLLRPYFLRLRSEKGDDACQQLVLGLGLTEQSLDDDSAWLSVAATTRALAALGSALGEPALEKRGQWATHPQALGGYVRMLRVASTLPEAYEYFCAHAGESTRVGTFTLDRASGGRAAISYRPREDGSEEERDALLCTLRRSELAALPRLWGRPDADIAHVSCLARGDASCSYVVTWQPIARRRNVPLAAGLGATLSAGSVALSGSALAAGIAGVVGGGLGVLVGLLQHRVANEHAARVLEKHRISALERGLELKGAFGTTPGDLVGVVLGGKYRIRQRIAVGGIGTVYAAEHLTIGSHVAVKVLRGAAAEDAGEVARLRREARVQVFVEHPNIVKVLDLDQMPDGSIYVVMELLHGMTLARRVKSIGPLNPEEAVDVFSKVCRALHAAHTFGIVHRDMKPGNIFLCDDGDVKLLDFGMSKLAQAESITQQGFTLGTPEYMSPEQCVGAELDGRADLYSVGVVMYEALSGSLPFRVAHRRDLLTLHQRQDPEPLSAQRPDLDLPERLERAVLACLAKRPDDRPSSAAELERLLESALEPAKVPDAPGA
ncbi:MAG: serine/threonine protein kinase [Myxococcales bacterium]|nr:serine/threonine protein kinase [Myxococcales bacterium]